MAQGIAGFIAVRDETKGLKIGLREPAMGLGGIPATEVIFKDMKIPEAMSVLGQERTLSALDFMSALPPITDIVAGNSALGCKPDVIGDH